MSLEVGHAPTSPWRLSAREWIDVCKRAFKSFLADDCVGLASQVAFSSLLAFFPAMVFLVGVLDLVGAYDTLKDFLAPVAPAEVLETIETLQEDTSRSTSVVAFVVGAALATLGGQRCHDRRDQSGQPRLRPGRDASVLEDAR